VACREIDEQVVRPGGELEELEKPFVCVRAVPMKGVDLGLFQFDCLPVEIATRNSHHTRSR
jgi:hypothetical protein